jgi:regulator of replication initiation timing
MSILDNLNAPEIEGLFEDGTIDGLDIVNIPIEDISKNANDKAQSLVEDLTEFYYDPEFLKNNPNFKKRVDNDLESLRMLLKMREADEVTHDVIIKAIAANSSNASLYRSLTQIQTTILQITTKIETIVNNLTSMIKSYQLELNFKMEQEQLKNELDEPTSVEDINSAHRGSKSFIEQMAKIEEQSLLKTEEESN